ncbi:acyltransferase domain-containing protein, partial [Streptomyces clavuligerus]
MSPDPAFLFPGQESYLPGVWRYLRGGSPAADEAIRTVEAVAAGHGCPPVIPLLVNRERTDGGPPGWEQRQLAVLAASLALAGYLGSVHRVAPGAVCGHGSGGFAALAAAGVLSVHDAAAALCERIAVLRSQRLLPGGMLALEASRERVEALLDDVGEPEVVRAGRDTARRFVVSGPLFALSRVRRAAEEAGVAGARLPVPYAFHHPALAPVAERLRERLRGLDARPSRCPVYSAVELRFLRPGRDDLADWLAADLIAPLSWYSVPGALRDTGIGSFVACGPGDTLARWIGQDDPG